MSDIFQEVDEEVRRERLKKLWDQYGILIIAAAVLLAHFGILVLTVLGFKTVPVGFIPMEDQGYLIGLAHFLAAALMPLRRDLAPLVYGVFVAVCMAYGALDHFRFGRGEKAP